jgi:uncharacterized membrane protein YqjE
MDPSLPPEVGMTGLMRNLLDHLVGGMQSRVELISIELQEEKYKLIQTFVWISAIVFTGLMAVAFGSITIIYYFWETERLLALGGLTALYAISFTAIVIAFRAYLVRQPLPFASTLEAFEKDRECIQEKN